MEAILFIFMGFVVLAIIIIAGAKESNTEGGHVETEEERIKKEKEKEDLDNFWINYYKEKEEKENKAKNVLDRLEDQYDSMTFDLAGLYYRSNAVKEKARYIEVGEEVTLSRNPSNQYDPYAVKVKSLLGHHIGFVPQDMSEEVTNRFKNIVEARVSDVTDSVYGDIPDISITIFFRTEE